VLNDNAKQQAWSLEEGSSTLSMPSYIGVLCDNVASKKATLGSDPARCQLQEELECFVTTPSKEAILEGSQHVANAECMGVIQGNAASKTWGHKEGSSTLPTPSSIGVFQGNVTTKVEG